MKRDLYERVVKRSGGQCEAMVENKVHEVVKWTRCWERPVEIHHALTKARGGRLLDAAGETYHLIALCRWHHMMSDGQQAYDGDLLIDGYVMSGPNGPEYTGSDVFLSKKYPQMRGNDEVQPTN